MDALIYKNTIYGGGGVMRGNYFDPIIYSTEEREVGVWKDNKPLYQKTFSVTINSTDYTLDLTTLNIEQVTSYIGYINHIDGTWVLHFPYYDSTRYYSVGKYNTDTKELHIVSTNEMVNYYPYLTFTIQYTKTTDVAGSGSYNTLGVPNVHYDGNEKVIGTWVDGKPLYQKTISFTVVGNNNYQRYDHEIDDIDMIFVDQGASFVYYGDATYPLIGYGGTPQNSQMAVLVWSGGFDYRAGVECNGATCYATLKYTKTTT